MRWWESRSLLRSLLWCRTQKLTSPYNLAKTCGKVATAWIKSNGEVWNRRSKFKSSKNVEASATKDIAPILQWRSNSLIETFSKTLSRLMCRARRGTCSLPPIFTRVRPQLRMTRVSGLDTQSRRPCSQPYHHRIENEPSLTRAYLHSCPTNLTQPMQVRRPNLKAPLSTSPTSNTERLASQLLFSKWSRKPNQTTWSNWSSGGSSVSSKKTPRIPSKLYSKIQTKKWRSIWN